MRVATKYPATATAHFTATGRQAEVVKVNGSVELAPLVGLAHGIVDLVATGRTLRENGLVEREEIFRSSARLIANRVSQTLRAEEVDGLVEAHGGRRRERRAAPRPPARRRRPGDRPHAAPRRRT